MQESYDCIVLGGGPAGSAAAALVAEAGHRTLLLERESMPRFHIGESLMPETYWIFERLGVLEKMKASRYPKKYSVQFVNRRGKTSQPFYFHKHDDRDCSQTWQVLRSDFDQMLWDNAAEKGAECRDSTRVLDVLFDGDRATGVKIQTADGNSQEINCRVVIDATGQQSLIARRLSLHHVDPQFRKSAIWTYYRGAHRAEGVDGGATVILHTREHAHWFWYIPLADGVTSVGLVGDTDLLFQSGDKPEAIFTKQLADCPHLSEYLAKATQCDTTRVAREFSYKSEQAAGEGWVLVGDAYGFIDPIYSSGVYFALKSAEMAADCVLKGLAEENLSAEQLGSWAGPFDEGANRVRRLVAAFYTNEFSFGQFLKAHPEHVGNLTDLLIGRIFHEGASDIFDDMEPHLERIRQETGQA